VTINSAIGTYCIEGLHPSPDSGIYPLAPAAHGCGCSSGVEHNLAKVGVEGSNPFARSNCRLCVASVIKITFAQAEPLTHGPKLFPRCFSSIRPTYEQGLTGAFRPDAQVPHTHHPDQAREEPKMTPALGFVE
jgi:hypothetical protein